MIQALPPKPNLHNGPLSGAHITGVEGPVGDVVADGGGGRLGAVGEAPVGAQYVQLPVSTVVVEPRVGARPLTCSPKTERSLRRFLRHRSHLQRTGTATNKSL